MSPENLQLTIIIGVAALLLLLAIWLVLRASRKTKVIDKTQGDVLDEGAARAARNQALIDSPPATAPGVVTTPAAEPAPVPEPVPVAAPAPTPTPTPTAAGDDLSRIKGLGPKIAALLAEQGVTSFAQIAAWSDADVERIDASLGRFRGRITRDQWVAQAKLLSAGDEAGFTAKFGQNG